MTFALRLLALGITALLLASPAIAQASRALSIALHEIGLKGYYDMEPAPTRLRFLLQGPREHARALHIRIYDSRTGPELGHLFQFPLSGGGESVDVPVLVPGSPKVTLLAEVLDGAGQSLARLLQELPPPTFGEVVAIVCDSDVVCQSTQNAIAFSGSSAEKTEKQRDLRFVEIREPPELSYAYSAVRRLVIASPLASDSAQARRAIEEYLRSGGRLIVLEPALADAAWLAPYRQLPKAKWHAVGLGRFYYSPNAKPEELGKLFPTGSYPWRSWYRDRDELPWLRRRLSTALQFPSFAWLVGWMTLFMLVAGPLNFLLLRRIRKQEWGWATTPALAILFAFALYFGSTANRPRTTNVDSVSLYWMDDRSLMAWRESAIRITSPRRAKATLVARAAGIFNGWGHPSGIDSLSSGLTAVMAGDFGGIRATALDDGGTSVEISLLPWSFHDLAFAGPSTLPGTIERVSSASLHNATGMDFKDSMLVTKDSVHFIGPLAKGAVANIQGAKKESIESATGLLEIGIGQLPNRLAESSDESWVSQASGNDYAASLDELRRLPGTPFHLKELIRGWPKKGIRAFERREALFFGLAEAESVSASIDQPNMARKNFVVVIVSLLGKP